LKEKGLKESSHAQQNTRKRETPLRDSETKKKGRGGKRGKDRGV